MRNQLFDFQDSKALGFDFSLKYESSVLCFWFHHYLNAKLRVRLAQIQVQFIHEKNSVFRVFFSTPDLQSLEGVSQQFG